VRSQADKLLQFPNLVHGFIQVRWLVSRPLAQGRHPRSRLILVLLAMHVTIPLPAATITQTILSGHINLEG
jgi:hypothetical protein